MGEAGLGIGWMCVCVREASRENWVEVKAYDLQGFARQICTTSSITNPHPLL